jgi:hypothetical protein
LQTVFIANMQKVAAIGRKGCQRDVTIVGEVFDGKVFEWNVLRFVEKGIDTENGSGDDEEYQESGESGADFVLASSVNQDGATRFRRSLPATSPSAAFPDAGLLDFVAAAALLTDGAAGVLPESDSRCSRFRSARSSAAT